MLIKSNITWRDYQAETLKDIMEHIQDRNNQHTFCICSPRQCGKSTLCESILLYFAINNARSFSMFVSPTFRQARKVFNEIKSAIEHTAIFESSNESQMELVFFNGSKIAFASGESSISALQGYTIRNGVLIFDEAAYQRDDVFNALFPAVDVFKSPVILASTPRFKDGLFYNYFMRGENHIDNVHSYNWQGCSLLKPDKLQFYKETMPDVLFRMYYLGEFVEFGDGVFGDFGKCINDNPVHRGRAFFGIDWSTGTNGDDTAICVMDSNGQMINLVYFNDKTETETINEICYMIKRYRPYKIAVELNSIGRIFYNLLKKQCAEQNLEPVITGLNTTNESKQKWVQQLQVAIQNQKVSFLNNKKFKDQMNNFVCSLTSSGKVKYAAAGNGHDDLVLATLFAYNAITKSNYTVL